MAGRAFAFSDPRVVEIIRDEFIPVAADDWYQRRRNDPVGRYFQYIVRQVEPRRDTRRSLQGMYAFTAAGELLAFKNAGKKPDVTLRVLRRAIDRWNQLPLHKRRPGAFELPAMSDQVRDSRYSPELHANGLVMRVYTRALERDDATGRWKRCSSKDTSPVGIQTAFDHMWLRQSDWQSLVDLSQQKERFSIPPGIAMRLARFHLVDNTRGEPDHWKAHQVHQLDLDAERIKQSAHKTTVRIRGSFTLATDSDLKLADRGYVGNLLGYFEVESDQLTRFQIGAIGDHWGEGRYTPRARKGRTPLGIFMVQADGTEASDVVPPQAFRSPDRYFNAATAR